MNFWTWADKHWVLVGFTVAAVLIIIYEHFPTLTFRWHWLSPEVKDLKARRRGLEIERDEWKATSQKWEADYLQAIRERDAARALAKQPDTP